MTIKRKETKIIKIGNKSIGGEHPILIQSMVKRDTRDVKAVVGQIKELEKAGCEIVRVAVPNGEAVNSLSLIKKQITIPLVADIHFNWRLAIKSIEQGVDKIRIGYGVICDKKRVKEILKLAKEKNVSIRIGVNAGSLDDDIRQQFGTGVSAMIESAMRYIEICENNDFFDIVVSIKSSDVLETIKAYEELSERISYPLHLGVTNAGTKWSGTIGSAVAMGSLLKQGIGDTIRVSLTGSPIEEVRVGREILNSLDIRRQGVRVVSCPTCGRLKMGETDFTKLVEKIEEALNSIKEEHTVSIIGCAVNGPGEALKADLGVMIVGEKKAALFRGGEIIKKVDISRLQEAILNEL